MGTSHSRHAQYYEHVRRRQKYPKGYHRKWKSGSNSNNTAPSPNIKRQWKNDSQYYNERPRTQLGISPNSEYFPKNYQQYSNLNANKNLQKNVSDKQKTRTKSEGKLPQLHYRLQPVKTTKQLANNQRNINIQSSVQEQKLPKPKYIQKYTVKNGQNGNDFARQQYADNSQPDTLIKPKPTTNLTALPSRKMYTPSSNANAKDIGISYQIYHGNSVYQNTVKKEYNGNFYVSANNNNNHNNNHHNSNNHAEYAIFPGKNYQNNRRAIWQGPYSNQHGSYY